MAKKSTDQDPLSKQLLQLITSIEASGIAVMPNSNDELLQSIVEAAARIFGAAAASILLVDEKEQVLVFKVAFGAADRDLVGMKFPLNKGIAGYVAMTGQPLATSNVRQDARFNQDFAKSTGYIPSSILATPLLAGERVIGVMEVLDKINASSFGKQDMELLAMFAKQAALAIDQSQNIDLINGALVKGLKRLAQTRGSDQPDELLNVLDQAGNRHGETALMTIAELFSEISALGEAEQKACVQILKVFAEYQHAKRRTRR